MYAAVMTEPRCIRIDQLATPEPRQGQVLVRVEGCGMCGSNLALWEGRSWFQYPLEPGAPGHEGWGRIEKTGTGVQGLGVGERVAFLSNHAFAEYDVADAAAVVQLPRILDGKPFAGEPLGCAVNVFRRSDVRPGQTVAIVGIGFLGAVLTRLASRTGARVIAISRRVYALAVARNLGAEYAMSLDDPSTVLQQVQFLTEERGCERVIEAVGQQQTLDLASELTAERGRLIIAGYHQDGLRQVNMQLWNWRGLDVVNAHERDPRVYVDGIRAAVSAVSSGDLDPSPLYTHRYGLERLADAFNVMEERPDGFLKALVTP